MIKGQNILTGSVTDFSEIVPFNPTRSTGNNGGIYIFKDHTS